MAGADEKAQFQTWQATGKEYVYNLKVLEAEIKESEGVSDADEDAELLSIGHRLISQVELLRKYISIILHYQELKSRTFFALLITLYIYVQTRNI